MKRLLAIAFLLFFPSMAAASCVTYNFAPNPGSGFHGFGSFENNCPYQVIIRFRYSDGQTGLAGPLKPGETERGYHGSAKKIDYTWCDWDASACSPAKIGSDGRPVNTNSALQEAARLYAISFELDKRLNEICYPPGNQGEFEDTEPCKNIYKEWGAAGQKAHEYSKEHNVYPEAFHLGKSLSLDAGKVDGNQQEVSDRDDLNNSATVSSSSATSDASGCLNIEYTNLIQPEYGTYATRVTNSCSFAVKCVIAGAYTIEMPAHTITTKYKMPKVSGQVCERSNTNQVITTD